MEIPWEQAAQVGGIGFGMVFFLLVILAIVIWLVGLVLTKTSTGKAETSDKEKGD